MADGFQLDLDQDLGERLETAAKAAGVSVRAYAQDILSAALEEDVAESIQSLAEYDRTGEFISLNEAIVEFDVALRDRAAGRA